MKIKTKNSIRFFGFTLVELLIVVVIIGILSAALLPRLTGHMARTRDLKRQTDLRNIAMELEAYKNNNWELPFFSWGRMASPCKSLKYFTSASDLSDLLTLNPFPKDPQSNAVIASRKEKHLWLGNEKISKKSKGHYLYTLQRYGKAPNYDALSWGQRTARGARNGNLVALLIAKTETADASNYVYLYKSDSNDYEMYPGCGFFVFQGNDAVGAQWCFPAWLGPELAFCSQIEKGSTAQRNKQADGTYHCTYTDPKQLYYILAVEEM